MTKGVRSEHTLTRKDLADAVYAVANIPRKEAEALVDRVISEICDALVRDGEIKLSNFGTFTVLSKPERMGRNPKTYKEHLIPAKRSISFKAAAGLKRKVNGATEEAKG